jgi:hypothetical protein
MIEFRQVASGGRCQWVLDTAFQAVEWLGQPLRFESVVLRTALDLRWDAILCCLKGSVPTGILPSPARPAGLLNFQGASRKIRVRSGPPPV